MEKEIKKLLIILAVYIILLFIISKYNNKKNIEYVDRRIKERQEQTTDSILQIIKEFEKANNDKIIDRGCP